MSAEFRSSIPCYGVNPTVVQMDAPRKKDRITAIFIKIFSYLYHGACRVYRSIINCFSHRVENSKAQKTTQQFNKAFNLSLPSLQKKIYEIIESNNAPKNGFEAYLWMFHETQKEFSDRLILQAYLSMEDTSAGYSSLTTTALFSHYFNRYNAVDFRGNYLSNQKDSDLAYFPEFPGVLTSENDVKEVIKGILQKELTNNPAARPNKIFFPLAFGVKENGKVMKPHSLLLVIEPSHGVLNEARITIINTHGDSIDIYRTYEIAALEAANEVYNSLGTTTLRNTAALYTTATSCGVDTLSYAIQLSTVDDVQQCVKKGLKKHTTLEDRDNRIKYGKALRDFLSNEYNWEPDPVLTRS